MSGSRLPPQSGNMQETASLRSGGSFAARVRHGDSAGVHGVQTDDMDAVCVVCLDAPREAIIVHGDRDKTTHQVRSGPCPALH